MRTGRRPSSPTVWLAIVAGVAILERLLVVLFYQPITYSDTPSYRRLADTVLQRFANYDGTRTPGYPVFLAITGSDHAAWLVQLCLGFLTTLLIFFIAWNLTHKAWIAGSIALAHTLNLGQLFFESNLLTESLTTFLLVLAMAGVVTWLRFPRLRGIGLAFLLGLVSTAALLVRPLFIYLPFLLLAFLLLEVWLRRRANKQSPEQNQSHVIVRMHPWRSGLAFMLPVLVLLGGWMAFIHKEFNEWSLTTMTGYHLVQHTGSYFEYVPDEYAALRDTYIKYRDEHIARYGTQTNAIWDAIPEMSRVSGYSFYALSRVLTTISIQLIEQHPILFIKNAISGWWMFWRAPVYWSAEALKLPAITPVIQGIILVERGLLILANIGFILGSLYFGMVELLAAFRRKPTPFTQISANPVLHSFTWMLLANIWIASVLQTLLDHGDNPRFLVPLQTLVVLWVSIFILQIFLPRRAQAAPTAQP